MIQHDMMLFDHGMPRATARAQPGAAARSGRQYEFQSTAKFADQGHEAGFLFRDANRNTPPIIRCRATT